MFLSTEFDTFSPVRSGSTSGGGWILSPRPAGDPGGMTPGVTFLGRSTSNLAAREVRCYSLTHIWPLSPIAELFPRGAEADEVLPEVLVFSLSIARSGAALAVFDFSLPRLQIDEAGFDDSALCFRDTPDSRPTRSVGRSVLAALFSLEWTIVLLHVCIQPRWNQGVGAWTVLPNEAGPWTQRQVSIIFNVFYSIVQYKNKHSNHWYETLFTNHTNSVKLVTLMNHPRFVVTLDAKPAFASTKKKKSSIILN